MPDCSAFARCSFLPPPSEAALGGRRSAVEVRAQEVALIHK